MVRIENTSEYEKLDAIITAACKEHGYKLLVQGWTRKTYDVFFDDRRDNSSTHLVRIESFATMNGEIRVYTDEAMEFAEALGRKLEEAFGLAEAVIVKDAPES